MSLDLTGTHQYLLSALVGLPAVVFALVLAGPLRKTMIVAGALAVPLSVPIVFVDPEYWSPTRLGDGPWGLEDILVCFELGALTWGCAAWPLRRSLVSMEASPSWGRLAAVGAAGAAVAVAFWLLGAGVIGSLVAVMGLIAAVLLVLRPTLWPLPAWAAVIYSPYYCTILWLTGAIAPDFFSIWDGPELWGPRLFGLPVDEIAFVVAFALCYPLIIGCALDVRIGPPGAESEGPGAKTPPPPETVTAPRLRRSRQAGGRCPGWRSRRHS